MLLNNFSFSHYSTLNNIFQAILINVGMKPSLTNQTQNWQMKVEDTNIGWLVCYEKIGGIMGGTGGLKSNYLAKIRRIRARKGGGSKLILGQAVQTPNTFVLHDLKKDSFFSQNKGARLNPKIYRRILFLPTKGGRKVGGNQCKLKTPAVESTRFATEFPLVE